MTYSAGFTAGSAGKVKMASVKQEIYHACRDLKTPANKKINLKSESIRPEFTGHNQTFLFSNGQWKKIKQVKKIFDEVDARFSDVVGQKNKNGTYRPVRKDAVAVREVVMQIGNSDNDYYAKYKDDLDSAVNDKSFKIMRDYVQKTYGDHALYFSIHADEGSGDKHHLHAHVGLDTIYTDDEGQKHINQRKALGKIAGSPKQMKAEHKRFYKFLKDAGLDVGLDPEKTAQTRQRLSQREYNKLKDSQAQIKQLDQREADVTKREEQHKLDVKVDTEALNRRRDKLDVREEELDARERNLLKREQDVEPVLKRAKKRENEAIEQINEANDMISKVNNRQAELEAIAERQQKVIHEYASNLKKKWEEKTKKLLKKAYEASKSILNKVWPHLDDTHTVAREIKHEADQMNALKNGDISSFETLSNQTTYVEVPKVPKPESSKLKGIDIDAVDPRLALNNEKLANQEDSDKYEK